MLERYTLTTSVYNGAAIVLPVGINLFLSAYRFDKPVVEVWRAVLPFLLILAMVVLLVTYVPWIIIGV